MRSTSYLFKKGDDYMIAWLKVLADIVVTDIKKDPIKNLVLPAVTSIITTVTLYLL